MRRDADELIGEVRGSSFTTRSLVFNSNPLCGAVASPPHEQDVKVVWNDERGWRLTRLYSGNQPVALPGNDQILDARHIQEGSTRVFILVANRSSGLFSCHNWLRCGKHGLKALSIDLVKAQEAASNPDDRLKAMAHNFHRQVTAFATAIGQQGMDSTFNAARLGETDDPVTLLSRLGECGHPAPEAVLLRNFDALEEESAERLFGGLRSLYEEAQGLPALVLLGHSTTSLDIEGEGPASSLLKLAESFTLSSLRAAEVGSMIHTLDGRRKVKAATHPSPVLQRLMSWTGGHPHLVQAICFLVQSDPGIKTMEEAIRFIARERLPAFDVWVQRLRKSLTHPEISRIVGTLLRKQQLLRSPLEHRPSLMELLVQGWIRQEPKDSAWVFRSDCHRQLAAEAFGQRG